MNTHEPVYVSVVGLVVEAASRGHGTYVPAGAKIPDEYDHERVYVWILSPKLHTYRT
jgi:hypothetical protein